VKVGGITEDGHELIYDVRQAGDICWGGVRFPAAAAGPCNSPGANRGHWGSCRRGSRIGAEQKSLQELVEIYAVSLFQTHTIN
jgi:hypothetical protein